jgi:lactate dehydrogenase-like 2-hydroxyacid dehydrogenase
MYSILYPDILSNDNFKYEKPIAGDKYHLLKYDAKISDDIPDEVWEKADALVTGLYMKVDEPLIEKLKSCKIITRMGVGYDLIDEVKCGEAGIVVSNVPDYGTYEVADHAISLIMNFARGISEYDRLLKINLKENWNYSTVSTIDRVVNKNIGIIGLGRIGTAFALRAKAFGFNVSFFDPYVPDGQEKALNIERHLTLEDLITSSDYISIHCLANKETENLINDKMFKLCKPNLVIVNTARGAIIDLDAAYEALKSEKIRAIGLDVLPTEPADISHPLINAWLNETWAEGRIILTPHSAFYSPTGLIFLREKALTTCLNHIEGINTANCINTKYLKKQR